MKRKATLILLLLITFSLSFLIAYSDSFEERIEQMEPDIQDLFDDKAQGTESVKTRRKRRGSYNSLSEVEKEKIIVHYVQENFTFEEVLEHIQPIETLQDNVKEKEKPYLLLITSFSFLISLMFAYLFYSKTSIRNLKKRNAYLILALLFSALPCLITLSYLIKAFYFYEDPYYLGLFILLLIVGFLILHVKSVYQVTKKVKTNQKEEAKNKRTFLFLYSFSLLVSLGIIFLLLLITSHTLSLEVVLTKMRRMPMEQYFYLSNTPHLEMIMYSLAHRKLAWSSIVFHMPFVFLAYLFYDLKSRKKNIQSFYNKINKKPKGNLCNFTS